MKLYDTLAGKKRAFEPLDPTRIRMYVCGPTVYDYAHIGNARPAVIFDVLFRLLRHGYGAAHVTYVRNITDVDDKIIARHRETGEAIEEITRRTADAYNDDMGQLACLPPSIEPRATRHIPNMIDMIRVLIEQGHAYAAEHHVLFDVPSISAYGRLSRRNLDEMIAGARVEVAPYKRHPQDFVLWKPSAPEDPGWDSPWGRGRPGWHIECSAMSAHYLGETFDIHGGGQDLIFPHHENEIAQSTCAHGGQPLARYWIHNGFLMTEGEKMSKSLGNFYTVHDLLGAFPGEAIRLVLLQTHYRQPLDFTKNGLARAKKVLDRFYSALAACPDGTASALTPPQAIVEALEDDLNTPLALGRLHEALSTLNKAADGPARDAARDELLAGGALLGLLGQEPEAWLKGGVDLSPVPEDVIETFVRDRTTARRSKDFATADRIRDELLGFGIILEDRADGTVWRRA